MAVEWNNWDQDEFLSQLAGHHRGCSPGMKPTGWDRMRSIRMTQLDSSSLDPGVRQWQPRISRTLPEGG